MFYTYVINQINLWCRSQFPSIIYKEMESLYVFDVSIHWTGKMASTKVYDSMLRQLRFC